MQDNPLKNENTEIVENTTENQYAITSPKNFEAYEVEGNNNYLNDVNVKGLKKGDRIVIAWEGDSIEIEVGAIGKAKPTCIYCDKNNLSTHFQCDVCGVGMCDDCYDSMAEHDSHYHEVCESADNKNYKAIIKEIGYEPAYLCEKCLSAIYKKHNL